MNFLYIIGTVVFTVYSQLVVRWRITHYGKLPAALTDQVIFFSKVLIDPFVISAVIASFTAALCWMAAMTKFELSFAYPFTSLSFVLVLLLSGLFFHEPVTLPKIIGILLIVSGIIVGTR
ncbi:EamA family transporter [Desulfobacterales bacterium HSG16]|nr:EamA family transporter [Desulfobacterales bacterium HSG16]